MKKLRPLILILPPPPRSREAGDAPVSTPPPVIIIPMTFIVIVTPATVYCVVRSFNRPVPYCYSGIKFSEFTFRRFRSQYQAYMQSMTLS